MSTTEIVFLAAILLSVAAVVFAIRKYGLAAVEARLQTFEQNTVGKVAQIAAKKPTAAPAVPSEAGTQSRINAAVAAAVARSAPAATLKPVTITGIITGPTSTTGFYDNGVVTIDTANSPVLASSAIAVADPAGTVIAPAPTGDTMKRDPFVIGPQVVAWALRQSDNFDVQTSAGAHPEIGIDGCDAITNYLCANPSFTIDAVGFEAAYQKTKAAPPATHPNPPIALTPEVSAKLVIYTTKCLTDWDKIAYLKLGGNSDLFNYLATNNLITSQWFMAADYATNSGQNFPAAQGGELVPSPRVWE